MDDAMKRLLVALILIGTVTAASAQQRLAVLEFFGRPTGAYCSAAGPAMIRLQSEMAGAAVLLEYDYDRFPSGRVDRFTAARPRAPYLPLVMVGSGFATSDGPVDYEREYRAMIESELARPAEAAVSAYWRRVGDRMRMYVRAVNLREQQLESSEEAGLWVLVWENRAIGVSSTWVRAAEYRNLSSPLATGAAWAQVVDTPALVGVDWSRLAGLAMLERRLGDEKRYDMLQAVEALPAGLVTSPDKLMLSRTRPAVEVSLTGPHVLAWSATADVPWLEVTPSSGSLPASPAVALIPEAQPLQPASGSVRFQAKGDGMAFSATVAVTAMEGPRRGGSRLSPALPSATADGPGPDGRD